MSQTDQVNPAIFDAVVIAKVKSGRPFVLLQPEVVSEEGDMTWLSDGRFDCTVKGIMNDPPGTEALISFLRYAADTIEDGLYER